MTLTKSQKAQRQRQQRERANRLTVAKPSSAEVEERDLINAKEINEENISQQDTNNLIIQAVGLDAADSSNEEDCDNEAVEVSLWPVFYTHDHSEPVTGKRKNLIKGYRRPVIDPQDPHKKLKPAPVSKQTKHDWKKKQKSALGKNTSMLANWLGTSAPSFPKLKSLTCDVSEESYQEQVNCNIPDLNGSKLDDQACHLQTDELEKMNQAGCIEESTSEDNQLIAYESHIDSCVSLYREGAKKGTKVNFETSVHQQWEQLNNAITHVEQTYQTKQKANPKFVFPYRDISDLREFNACRKELSLSLTKQPAVTALVLTALSSSRRDAKQNTQFSSGRSRARHIRFQANHLIKFRELDSSKTGHASPHPSMLDDSNVFQDFFGVSTLL